MRPFRRGQLGEDARGRHGERRGRPKEDIQEAGLDKEAGSEQVRGTFKSKAPLRVQFSPALGGGGGGKGLKPKLLLGFTK